MSPEAKAFATKVDELAKARVADIAAKVCFDHNINDTAAEAAIHVLAQAAFTAGLSVAWTIVNQGKED